MKNKIIKAVITGDIIHSKRMDNAVLLSLFKSIKDSLKIWDKDFNMISEMFRGDSFQCFINTPEEALRIALIIKTYIRSLNPHEVFDVIKETDINNKKKMAYTNWMFDVRIGIGVGEVDLITNTLANSNGIAFHLSGQALDGLKNSKQHIAINTIDNYSNEWLTEIVMLDALISKTSSLQCEVLYLKLLGYTEIQIAQRLNIGQSAVNQRSVSGNWHAINTMVKRFENVYING